ncbi:MAG: DUF368 domain-containing protein [Bacteroidales bacterium]|nr:DUF368 domain-containing protein [Bacteroidales bacterium]
MKGLSHYLILALKGVGMGAANVIPGVSGGTIAFLTGIYEELLNSIKSINLSSLKLLCKGQFKAFWEAVNGNFLLSLGIGIVVSILSLAKLMTAILEKWPIQTWSFFFGLVLVSTIFMVKELKGIRWNNILSALIGVAFGVAICLVSPSETGSSLPFILLCGAVAMCTMVLPGISGSFILVLLGKYAFIMDAVGTLNIPVLAVFAVGAIAGLLAFSHLLSWLLKKFYNGTILFLAGLMIGSLVKVWPWKMVLASGVDRPVLPGVYAGNPCTTGAIVWCVVGILFICALEYLAGEMARKNG